MSHVTRINESRHTYKRFRSPQVTHCFLQILSFSVLSIGVRISFTTNELVDRIGNLKSNAQQNDSGHPCECVVGNDSHYTCEYSVSLSLTHTYIMFASVSVCVCVCECLCRQTDLFVCLYICMFLLHHVQKQSA